jgi:hypothetical protein
MFSNQIPAEQSDAHSWRLYAWRSTSVMASHTAVP